MQAKDATGTVLSVPFFRGLWKCGSLLFLVWGSGKVYSFRRLPFDTLRQALRQAQGPPFDKPFDKLRDRPSTSSGSAQGPPFDTLRQALRQAPGPLRERPSTSSGSAQGPPFDTLRHPSTSSGTALRHLSTGSGSAQGPELPLRGFPFRQAGQEAAAVFLQPFVPFAVFRIDPQHFFVKAGRVPRDLSVAKLMNHHAVQHLRRRQHQ